MKGLILKSDFFKRDAKRVAKDLVGKCLIRKTGKETKSYLITEVEAYLGESDKASHARFGKTSRNLIMYGPAGIFYVYLIYGMYWMLNIVTDKKGSASAVLIRGLEELNGPGKITKNLKIDNNLNGKKASKENGLWFEDRGFKAEIRSLPRVGIGYAGPKWQKARLRFSLKTVEVGLEQF